MLKLKIIIQFNVPIVTKDVWLLNKIKSVPF